MTDFRSMSFVLRAGICVSGALTALFLGLGLFGGGGVWRRERLDEELRHIRELNDELVRQNAALRHDVHALASDPAAVDAVIRDELGWIRNDELVIFYDTDDAASR